MRKTIAGGSGSATGIEVALPRQGATRPAGLTRFLENERLLAMALLSPTVVLLGLFIAYPFVMGVWLSLSSTSVGNPGVFVGLANFIKAWDDSIFQTAFKNTFFYTFWATIFKLTLGMWLALLLNRHFRGKRLVRASMLLPFIIPTVLSTFAWRWMFDPTFSVLNWLLYQTGLITTKLPFLSDGTYGMWCAIVVNTWRGMPFFAITLLAGLQTISTDLQEAVLDHPDLLRLPAHLRADRGRPRQRDPPARDLCLSDRRGHRAAGRGRRDLAVHATGALHRRVVPAPLPAAAGGRLK